jgi:hypothetical protein
MVSSFKELNLDRKQLEKFIDKYCCAENNKEKISFSPLTNNNNCYRLVFKDEDETVIVNFHYIKNGTTTITPTGKYPQKGEALANFLKENILTDSKPAIIVSLKEMQQDSFDMLLSLLKESFDDDDKEEEFSLEINDTDPTKKAAKITSLKYQDSLNITYYTSTQTLLIQGKPLYTYSKTSYFLAEFLDFKKFMQIAYKGGEPNKIDVDTVNVNNELHVLLSHSYEKLDKIIINMLTTSYILKDIDVNLPDYSCYVFPSLRSLEGVMKSILYSRFIPKDPSRYFGELFLFSKEDRKYIATETLKSLVDNKTCIALEKCYRYYNSQRHELFHVDDFVSGTKVIENKDNASQIIEKVIKIIDEAYYIMSS